MVLLSVILGGFETYQKQIFIFFEPGNKLVFFEKSVIFLRFFYFHFFFSKIVFNPTEN